MPGPSEAKIVFSPSGKWGKFPVGTPVLQAACELGVDIDSICGGRARCCRDREICNLRWEWEVQVPELKTSVFIVPGRLVKNGDERLVVLNRIARSVVESVRGIHPSHVFTYKGHPVTRMLNSAWLRARQEVDLRVRVHDLKHTFGRRLRAAGVSFEDRQDLLGHRSGRITTHYSAAELSRLIEAANSVCGRSGKKPDLVVLRRLSRS